MSESAPPPGGRWQVWLALVWAVGFGTLYARMVIVERIPALAEWLGWR